MPGLFLSHTSVDKPFVEKLAKDLKRLGFEVWYDKWEIRVGESITWKIEEGLRENDYLVLILSPEALASEWVKTEISAAWFRQMNTKKVIVLPILYRQCDIPLFLADRKYADFRNDYNSGLAELVDVFGMKSIDTISEDNWRTFMNNRSVDWKYYRKKEFEILVTTLVNRAKCYNWSCWVGGSKNPFSITFSAYIDHERSKCISIKMVRGKYMASFADESNPNRLKTIDYVIYVGNSVNECEEFLWRYMEDFKQAYGNPSDDSFEFTRKYLNDKERIDVIKEMMQKMDWYQYEK